MHSNIKRAAIFLTGILLTGCATSSGTRPAPADELKARVDSLERQVAVLTQQLQEASQTQGSAETANFSGRSVPSSSANTALTIRQVQQALTAAGYYKGPVDGKKGPQTKKAVKEFQKAEGLKSDGVVGKATSEALSKHLPQ